MAAFPAAAFLASFLLFTLELVAARLLLPRFGGAAAVWTASMVLFQALLLAGYLWTAGALAWLGAQRYRPFHLGLLAAAGVLGFPLGVAAGGGSPAAAVAHGLLVGVGLPFFALSTTTPVLQSWLGKGDGYHLYAASNAGALAALLGYPLLIEPWLGVEGQLRAWRWLYWAFVLLAVLCPSRPDRSRAEARPAPAAAAVWTLLALAPSAALLAATNLLSLDYAAVPLLWALPLAVYLSTFILCFAKRPLAPRRLGWGTVALMALWAGLAALTMLFSADLPQGWSALRLMWALNKLVFVCAALFLVSLLCHRALAQGRPADGGAGWFYACVGLGGLLGSLLIGVVMPRLGRAAALPELDWALAGALAFLGLLWSDRLRGGGLPAWARWGAAPALGALLLLYARGSPALAPGAVAWRNFYGFYRVEEGGGMRRFYHGGTMHGVQWLDPERRDEPLLYYHRGSPIAQVFSRRRPRRVGVLGLGVGSLAAYGAAGQEWDFFELDADVIAMARARFSHLSRGRASARTVAGDARLSLAAEAGRYDLLVLDVFTGGAIPVHLLTREALALYEARLAPRGLLAVHLSNRFLDLRPVLAELARDGGWAGAARREEEGGTEDGARSPSSWAVLSKDARAVAPFRGPGWRDLSAFSRGAAPWTDDHASVLGALAR